MISVLKELKRQGKLSKTQNDEYIKGSVALAKQLARDKRYDDAISLLEPIAKSSKEAANLLKRYKQIQRG
jgi:hypothetical protein